MTSRLELLLLTIITGYSHMQREGAYNELLGTVANRLDFPGLVSVQYAQLNKGHICCGIIVSNHYVVSAASCYAYLPDDVIKDWLYIIVGGNSITPDGNIEQQILRVKKIIFHPAYNYTPRHDIALLYIQKGVRYDGEFIKNMPIGNEDIIVNRGTKCRTAGWAVSDGKHLKVYSKLMAFKLAIVNESSCPCLNISNECYQKGYCAASMENKMACFTFSANPLVCNGIVVGIRSANQAECVTSSNATLFLATWPYLGWINDRVTSNYISMKRKSESVPTCKATYFTLLIIMAAWESLATF